MKDKIQYHFSIEDYEKVLRLISKHFDSIEKKDHYAILMYKAHAQANVFQDEEALKTFDLIIELFPEQIDAKINKASILMDNGKFDQARNQLEKARTQDPNNLDILYYLIDIEEQIHNFEKVLHLGHEAIQLDSSNASLWLTISSANERLGNYSTSIENANEALKYIDGDDNILQAIYNNLGYTYSKMKQYTNAEYYLRKAIEIDESEPFQFDNLGLVLAMTGKIDEGFKYINHSIKLDHTNSYAFKNRAKVYLLNGNQDLAHKDLLMAKNLDYELDYDNEVNELLENIETRL